MAGLHRLAAAAAQSASKKGGMSAFKEAFKNEESALKAYPAKKRK